MLQVIINYTVKYISISIRRIATDFIKLFKIFRGTVVNKTVHYQYIRHPINKLENFETCRVYQIQCKDCVRKYHD